MDDLYIFMMIMFNMSKNIDFYWTKSERFIYMLDIKISNLRVWLSDNQPPNVDVYFCQRASTFLELVGG